MRYLVVEIDGDPECPIAVIGLFADRAEARTAAKNWVTRYPGSRTGAYEYMHGYSSASRVDVTDEYYPPEPPVEKLPEVPEYDSGNPELTD